jgi:hypothetical protein
LVLYPTSWDKAINFEKFLRFLLVNGSIFGGINFGELPCFAKDGKN